MNERYPSGSRRPRSNALAPSSIGPPSTRPFGPIAEDCERDFTAKVTDLKDVAVLLGPDDTDEAIQPYSFRRMDLRLRIALTIQRIDLVQKRIEGVADYSVGEAEIGDQPMRVVFSESQAGSKASFQVQQDGKWQTVRLQKHDPDPSGTDPPTPPEVDVGGGAS